VAVLANYGLQGSRLEWDGYPVYPSGSETWSNDVIGGFARHWFASQPGIVMTLFDTWVWKHSAFDDLPVACWTPVDHVPTPPKVIDFFNETGATPIAMSEFGRDSLKANGLDPLYAPHGIEDIYKPVPDARQLTGLPEDAFIVGMVSTNKGVSPSRKAFDVAFRTFAMFLRDVPDAILYVHSEARGNSGGVDLWALATHYDIPPANMIFTDQFTYRLGLAPDKMAALYSSFDVLSFATMGEGFGIPAVEAQACGCPVIVSDFTAQTELCGAGWKVPVQLTYDVLQAADFGIPRDEYMYQALIEAHGLRGDMAVRERARQFGAKYHADHVFNKYWRTVMARLEDRFSMEPIKL
jgi:glycosyltransferase involved in cell wall biosynthesis